MNDHFTPVGKPAPPRPRSPESLTVVTMSAGAIVSAFCRAVYPPRFFHPSSVAASGSPKYFESRTDSRSCDLCGYPISSLPAVLRAMARSAAGRRNRSFESREDFRNALGRHGFNEVFVDLDWRGKAARAKALHLDHGEPAIGRRRAELLA